MDDPHRKPPPLPPTRSIPFAVPAGKPQSGVSVVGRFFLGASIGVLLSALVWIWGWTPITSNGILPFLLFPAFKFSLGLGFLFVPRWRSFGGGILVSMALGALILGGMAVRSAANAVSNMPDTGLSSLCSVPKPSPYSPSTQPADSTTEPSDAATKPSNAVVQPSSDSP